MNDMRKIMETVLNEMGWRDKSPVVPILKQYPGKFVHFSDIPKLGINPNKHHADPYGIYFYPVDWLLNSDFDRLKRGDQYGVSMPYYFIISVDFSQDGIILSTFTWDDFNRIAERNGWKYLWDLVDQYDDGKYFLPTASLNPSFKKAELTFPLHLKKDNPASVLWCFGEVLNTYKLMSWASFFKGISYIYDDNNSVIHYMEPHQLLMLNSKAMKIVDSNVHKKIPRKVSSDNWGEWKIAINNIMNSIVTKYNGNIKWENKRPSVIFTIEDKQFILRYEEKWNSGLILDCKYGRASDYFSIPTAKIENITTDELIDFIDDRVQNVVSLKSDLLFEPIITQQEVYKLSEDIFVNGSANKIKWETAITNYLNDSDKTYAAMRMKGKYSNTIDNILVETTLFLDIYQHNYTCSVLTVVNGENVSYASNKQDYEYYASNVVRDSANNFVETIHASEQRWVKQENDDRWYAPRFSDHMEWKQFLGWLALNCGLSFDDALKYKLSDEIEDYKKLSEYQKHNLIENIKYVIRKSS